MHVTIKKTIFFHSMNSLKFHQLPKLTQNFNKSTYFQNFHIHIFSLEFTFKSLGVLVTEENSLIA